MFRKRFTFTEYDENGQVIARSSRRLFPWAAIKAAACLGLALSASVVALGGATFALLGLIFLVMGLPGGLGLGLPLLVVLAALPLAAWAWRKADALSEDGPWGL